MPAPIFFLIIPVILAILTYLFRRWSIVITLIGMIAVGGLAFFTWLVNQPGVAFNLQFLSKAWLVYGHPFILADQTRTVLIFVYLAMGFIYLLSLFLPHSSSFIPFSLLVLSPMAAALMVQPFEFGAVLLLIAVAISTVLIQGERAGSTLASMRYISITALAVPLLLTAGWMLRVDQAGYLSTIAFLILAAFLILLISFPFSIWVSPAVNESQSLIPAVIMGLLNLMVVVFVLQMLVATPFIFGSYQFLNLVRSSGIATLVIACILVLIAQSFDQLLAYILLLDIGTTVLALGFGGRFALQAMLTLLVLRTIGLIIAGVGLGFIRDQLAGQAADQNTVTGWAGLARRAPFGVALFIYGSLSLAGAPLTPGFIGRWMLITSPQNQIPWPGVILVISTAIATLVLLKRFAETLQENQMGHDSENHTPLAARVVASFLLVAGLVIALLPHLIPNATHTLAGLF